MHLVYAYIPTPTRDQLLDFVVQLSQYGMRISRLGKKDPPRKWKGTAEDAVALICSDGLGTNHTFAEMADMSLSMTIELCNDPRWGYSTISFDCPEQERVESLTRILLAILSPYLCIRGKSGLGKDQAWEILHQAALCPDHLRDFLPVKGNAAQDRESN
jgi:hypothetical protein